ncbi:MAG: hypothetical protein K6F34_01250 [Lachnospiraceae bacterium]|nr:hypothetical protein [Lachnospiraceae bacterium]
MNKTVRTLLKLLLFLLASAAAGYILLVIVYCIPVSRMKGPGNSVGAIRKDDADLSEVITGYPGSRLDVFTDGAMLNTAIHTNDENVFRRAVACHQYTYKGLSPAQAFIAFFADEEPDGEVTYVRYWHGFLVVLKPLLIFFSYSDIRMLNVMGQMLLVFITLYGLIRRKLTRYVPAVLMMYFFLTPVIMPLAMQYSTVFYIGFGSLACIILFYDRIKEGDRRLYLFMLTGILTSYMDLLTYPVFTLGIPLAGWLMLESEEGKEFKDAFIRFVSCGLSWFAGYALMWISKILISIPFYGFSSITDTVTSVSSRSAGGAQKEGLSYGQALSLNFFMYKNDIYRILLILYTVAVVLFVLYGIVKKRRALRAGYVPMLICVMFIPFVWYLVTIEHACVHAFMTYRNLTVAVFAYCICLMSLYGPVKEGNGSEGSLSDDK